MFGGSPDEEDAVLVGEVVVVGAAEGVGATVVVEAAEVVVGVAVVVGAAVVVGVAVVVAWAVVVGVAAVVVGVALAGATSVVVGASLSAVSVAPPEQAEANKARIRNPTALRFTPGVFHESRSVAQRERAPSSTPASPQSWKTMGGGL